jgi:hypothetical protein
MASTFNTFSMSAQNTVNCAALTQGVNLNLTQGGTAPFSIQWSNGMTNDTISGLSPGTYSVLVRDSNQCVASYMTTFEAVTPIVLNETITHPLCYGEATGSITMQVNGGAPPYSPLWNTGETTTNISELNSGTYFVIFSDQRGCSGAEIYQLTDPTEFMVNLQETDIFYSSGGTIDLTVSGGTPPYVYDWSNGSTNQDQSGLDPGFYEVIVHDANGCELSLNTEVQIAHPYGPIDTPAQLGSATSVSGLVEGGGVQDFSYYYDNEKHEIDVSWKNGGSIEVLDLNGKLIYSDLHLSVKGNHRIFMDAVGTYVVRLRNERAVREIKLLVY